MLFLISIETVSNFILAFLFNRVLLLDLLILDGDVFKVIKFLKLLNFVGFHRSILILFPLRTRLSSVTRSRRNIWILDHTVASLFGRLKGLNRGPRLSRHARLGFPSDRVEFGLFAFFNQILHECILLEL